MLYVMRHGKTDWNAAYRLQGRTDIPLNEEGRQMARDAAIRYKDVHIDVCYSSPLIRAVETAELVLKDRNIPIIKDDRLVEMSFGVYEGTQNLFEKAESNMLVFFKDPEHYVADNGAESMEELFARTGSFLEEVVKKDLIAGKDVLIVGHGAMNSSIICQVKNLPIAQFWDTGIPNCELIKIW